MTEGKPELKVEPIQTNAAQVGPCRVVAQEFFSRVAAEKEKKARDSLSSFWFDRKAAASCDSWARLSSGNLRSFSFIGKPSMCLFNDFIFRIKGWRNLTPKQGFVSVEISYISRSFNRRAANLGLNSDPDQT
jgi:hypothetical protein